MAAVNSRKSGDHLVLRSDVAQAKQSKLPDINDIVIVEDETFDAKRLAAIVNLVIGRQTTIRIAPSLNKAIDAVLQSSPDLMFLDDYLEPSDSALDTMPMVRRAGYQGPIVVISGELDRERLVELEKAGASDAVHKDELNSVDLGALLVRIFEAQE
jgi:DNA-binding NarL/FixJ family response regulator